MTFMRRVQKLESLKQRVHKPFNPEKDDAKHWLRARLTVGWSVGSRVTRWKPEDGNPEDYINQKMAEQ